LSGELSARAIDLSTSRVTHCDGYISGLESADELVFVAASRSGQHRARRRIHRDEIHVHPTPVAPAGQHLSKPLGAGGLIIDIANQDVLDRDSTLGRLGMTLALSLHAPDDELRDELVPSIAVGTSRK
jgi:hypothetical protein